MLTDLKIRPFRHEDWEPLVAAAGKDNHLVLAPSHVVMKDNAYVGFLSLGNVPTVLAWLDTKQIQARESATIVAVFENILSAQGVGLVLLPLPTTSPFLPLVEKDGYVALGDGKVFMKNLQGKD